MDVKAIIVIIILFIFADLLFYVVVMKGLMVKSIRGKSHADEMRDRPAREDGPAFSAQLHHHDSSRSNSIAWVAISPSSFARSFKISFGDRCSTCSCTTSL